MGQPCGPWVQPCADMLCNDYRHAHEEHGAGAETQWSVAGADNQHSSRLGEIPATGLKIDALSRCANEEDGGRGGHGFGSAGQWSSAGADNPGLVTFLQQASVLVRDTGVPMKRMVAGVAMGQVLEPSEC